MQAKDLANPFEYQEYIEKKKQEKLEAELSSRIAPIKKLPKVNRTLAKDILEKAAEAENKDAEKNETKKGSSKKKGLGSELFKDERFGALFTDENYEIDELSQEYRALHPMAPEKRPSLVEEHFDPVMENEDQDLSDSDASAVSQSSEDEPGNTKNKKRKSQVPRLYEVKDEKHAEAFWNDVSLAQEDSLPIGERVAALGDDQNASYLPSNVKFGPGGSREISFVTKSSAKYQEDKDVRHEKRRGVQSLRLKSSTSGFRGRGRGNRGKGRRGKR
uniref:Uncharacterized protein MANES_15G116200 n=1 Tax=Rhizophora mucronata TaxID=61149 RepID=A0A2P2KSK5_RHIMU